MAMQSTRRGQGPTPASGGVAHRGEGKGDGWTSPPARRTDGERLGDALGWLGLGVGLAALVAPSAVGRVIGVGDGVSRPVLRLVGLRDIASGVGILGSRQPSGWLWARVAGDLMDLASLGVAGRGARRTPILATAAAVAGVTALDVLAARHLSRREDPARALPPHHALTARKSVTVNRSAEPLYRFWRDFTNLPRVMRRLESVEVAGERRSHWKARGLAGIPVEWDAELVEDQSNERIAWRSVPGAPLEHSGVVRFRPAPGERGTTVTVEMEYTPPAGVLGARIARLLGQAPEQQLQEDLRRFKQLMETGEITVSKAVRGGPAQPVGPRPSALAEAGGPR